MADTPTTPDDQFEQFDDVLQPDGTPEPRVSVYDVLKEAGITVKHRPADPS